MKQLYDFSVIDIETTGRDPRSDDITELAAVRVRNGQIVDSFQELANVGTNDFACSLGWNSLRPSVRSNNQSSGQDVANMRRHVELLLRR